jgi:hypothetical protein
VVALFAARSPRWSWLVASGVVALGAHSGWLGIVAFALLGVAAADAVDDAGAVARLGTAGGLAVRGGGVDLEAIEARCRRR